MFKVERGPTKPLTWWRGMQGHIDFDPVYQRRRGIWSRKAQAYLVDSILNGYDIPKLYIADFTRAASALNKKKKMYAIIDGKQRFDAIFGFFNDKFPLDKDFVYRVDSTLHLEGMCYSQLQSKHPEVARRFDEYQLDVMSVITDEERKIDDLFVRLNKNTERLTGAEVRNAMPGIVPILARRLANHPFFKSRISFSVLRAQDMNAATKILLIESTGNLVSTKKADLDRFAGRVKAEAGRETEPYREAGAQVRRVLDSMAMIFGDCDELLGASGMVPVFYWFVRNNGEKRMRSIRPFLQQFERRRRENDQRPESGADKELLQYSNSRRSPNDQGALTHMYEVLERRFRNSSGD